MTDDFLSADTILKLSHDCALIYDENGIIEQLNSVAVKTLRMPKEEILGKHISNFIEDGYFPNHLKPGESVCENGDIEKKVVTLVKDKNKNNPRQYSLSLAPIKIRDGWRYCAFATELLTPYPIIDLNGNHNVVIDEEFEINEQDMLDGIMEGEW